MRGQGAPLTHLGQHAYLTQPADHVLYEVHLPLGEDVDLDDLRDQLRRRAEKLEQGISAVDKKLANPRFVENADPDIVDGERARRAELEVELSSLRENLAGL